MACQTRLSLPPAVDLDSLVQSFASNSDQDYPLVTASNSSLNTSQIRRKLFSVEDDSLDEASLIAPPRRSSSFDVQNRTMKVFSSMLLNFSFSLLNVHQVQVNNKIV